ncbi:histidine kinase [Vagococcus lutrae]|uniref:histidine kinase n=1 Tax=Vagococcus lutrae TaxID=81947 RepID=UPI00200E8E3B|nr:histidine kinase [Vagococcus lutrae]UQF70684.1 histidine kinase [Vagococcus lutrae]
MENNRKYLFLFFLFILTGFRLIWFMSYQPNEPLVKNGKVHYKYEMNDSINLDGEWLFYKDKWVLPTRDKIKTSQTIEVPQSWNRHFTKNQDEYKGTYYLKVTVPEEEMHLALYTGNIKGLSNIFIGNELIYSQLNEGKQREFSPRIFNFEKEEGENQLKIVVQVVNTPHQAGGIVRSMKLGPQEYIEHKTVLNRNSEIFTSTILLIVGLFSLSLFFIAKINSDYLHFAGVFLSLAFLYMLSTGEKAIFYYITLSPQQKLKLELFLIMLTGTSLLKLVKNNSRNYRLSLLDKIEKTYFMISIVLLLLPIDLFLRVYGLYLWIFIGVLIISIWNILELEHINMTSRRALFYSLLSMFHHMIWWRFVVGSNYSLPHYPFDIVLSVFFVLIAWVKNYEHLFLKTKELTNDLENMNHTREIFLGRVSRALQVPLNSMNILLDSMVKQEKINQDEITIPIDEFHLLKNINLEVNNLIENLMGMTRMSDVNQIENIRFISVIDKIEYVSSLSKHDKMYSHIKPILNMDENNNSIAANPQMFIQILFQIYSIAKKIEGTKKIYFENKKVKKEIKIKIILINSDIDDEHVQFVKMTLHEPNLAPVLFDYTYGVEVRLIQTLVKKQDGRLEIERSSCGLVFNLYFQHTEIEKEKEHYKERIRLLEYYQEQDNFEGRGRVLVISDDYLKLLTLKKSLMNDGYIVRTMESNENMYETIRSFNPNIVLMDAILKTRNGYHMTEVIRKKYQRIELPVILILTNDYEIEIKNIYHCGANDHIVFPLDYIELTEKVGNLLYTQSTVEESLAYEISWLQAQIEPHFLFNTLNTIVGLSQFDEEKMYVVLDAFIELLHAKYNLSKPDQLITLEQELHLVKAYSQIEEIRFEDKLSIVFDIDTQLNLREIKIIPLVLQPLVENAIRHGILPKKGKGSVKISIYSRENEVIIQISDDGVGTNQTLEEILHDNSQKTGIGLVNTYDRIRKVLDAEFIFKSEKNIGTDILIFLKKGGIDNESDDCR